MKMKGFIYSKANVSLDELQDLLPQLVIEPSYYFLRSPHAVSGICMKLPPEFPMFEGQMFNANCELRWKKHRSNYDILLLSKTEFKHEGFAEVSGNWVISDFNAYFNENETKFPNGFIFKGLNDENIESSTIGQRYFQDSDTATVHFIALTVK
ncbi:MAG: hypothetical protein VKL59_21660 [Nostocaceae cyanobacterium]|nr:hypothetical protein [Nostocaceae cyanobacterium]